MGNRRRRSLEDAVRASPLGHHAGRLRKASPATYARLRSLYVRLARGGDPGGLSPYQRRALDDFLSSVPTTLLADGVLEIGSDLDGKVLHALQANGVSSVVGLNPALTPEAESSLNAALQAHGRVQAQDLLSSGLPSASFGAVFSVAVFEHLAELDRCLAELHRLLVPGGIVYAAFGPIWGSSLGHHIFVDCDGVEMRHWDPRLNPIDDHAHLLQSSDEIRNRLAARYDEAVVERAVDWIFHGDAINRVFYEDFVASFKRSGFQLVRLIPEREHVPAHRRAKLEMAYPGKFAFDVRNAVVVLGKDERDG